MKKILYILLTAIISLSFASCLFQEDNIFDDSAANRMTKALKEYNEILKSAPNGWLVEYYAEKEPQKMGGYNFIWNFEDGGIVKVAADTKIKGIEVGTQVSSDYDLIADQGPVLTFNTYNSLIHYFTEPHGTSDLDGYAGDFEFVVFRVASDKILLTGKKNRNTITMKALPSGVDQTEYLKKTNELYEKTLLPRFKVVVNGNDVGYVAQNFYKYYTFTYNEGATGAASQNVVFNPDGFKFYEPITINNVEASEFKWEASGSSGEFVCKDGNNEVKFIPSIPEGYLTFNDYIGKFDANYNSGASNRVITISEKVYNSTFNVTGLFPITIEFRYNFSEGIMEVFMQDLPGNYGDGLHPRLCLWAMPGSGSYTWSTTAGGKFIRDNAASGYKFAMEDNKLWGSNKVTGLLMRLFNSSNVNTDAFPGSPDRIAGPIILTKQ